MAARPSAPELVKRIYEEFGALPGNGWGMTETTATVTTTAARIISTARPAAAPPVAVADLKIVDADGATRAAGRRGRRAVGARADDREGLLEQARGDARRPSSTAGSAPATSRGSTRRASATSSIAPRTW